MSDQDKKNEHTAREIAAWHKDIVDHARDLIQCVDSKGRFIYVNQAMLTTLNYSAEEIDNLTLWDIIHPDSMENCMAVFEQVFTGKAFDEVEAVFVAKDGTGITVEGNVGVKLDENGRFVHTCGIFRDVTNRKQIEEALRKTQFTVDKSPLSIFWISPEGHFTYVNKTAVEKLGYSREELLSMHVWDVDPHNPQEGREEMWNLYREERVFSFESEHRRRDGTTFPVRVNSCHLDFKGQEIEVAEAEDITDLKQAEKALQESEKRYRQIADNTSDVIWIADMNFNLTYVSPSIERLVGETVDEHLKKNLDQKFTPQSLEQIITIFQEEMEKEADPSVDKNRTRIIEVEQYKSDGKTIWVDMHISGLRDEAGNIIGFQGVTRDITERKEAEANLKKIEWMLSQKQTPDRYGQAEDHDQGYGDLTELNSDGIILKSIDPELLRIFSNDYMELLGTSSAIYEVNGDYAFGIFASGWCQMLDKASRNLCDTPDNFEALNSGRWLCHESCWTDCAKQAILKREQVDIECSGGIRMYAVPIFVNGEVVGAINIGYGDPPKDREKLQKLADAYHINYDDLVREAHAYDTRPPYIVEMAKKRLHATARLIGSMVETKQAEDKLHEYEELQQLLMKMATDLINVPLEKVDAGIDRMLEAVGNFTKVDRVYIFNHDYNRRITFNTHEWCAEGITPEIDNLQATSFDYFPGILEAHKKGEVVHIPDVARMPGNHAMRSHFEAQDIQSLILLPMFSEDVNTGFVGFDAVKQKKAFTEHEINLLKVLAEITSNVLARQKTETKLRYISFHDQLTGLYNRYFLGEEMERLNTKRQLPLTVIMADLNGLKLVNDTYGHETGDQLLKTAADIIRNSCREEDIVARWGGDEFVILLPQAAAEEARLICKRIKEGCRGALVEDVPVSIALGIATKTSKTKNPIETLQEAENEMYRQKLTERRSTKSAVVTSLLNTLAEKSFETEKHTRGMQEVAQKIGANLNLPDSELQRLDLLITLHDIGKINISEAILTKKSSLTDDDWEAIKKHPEIGYRIAMATEEFAHAAEDILEHHERWDGRGYPQGLKGNDITLLARIVAIADAYEVMSNGRPYKRPLSQEEIAAEFKRCAGTQFDPKLVEIILSVMEADG